MTNFDLVKERLLQVPFAPTQYHDEVVAKKSITLHHTAGGTAESSIIGWRGRSDRLATCVVIDRDGTIMQCFPSNKWAFSLGINAANYKDIERQTIAIELASYGYLHHEKGSYYNAYQQYMAEDKVCILDKPFKGYIAYERYTAAQIESTRRLLLLWHERYGIDIKYQGDRIFALCPDALAGAGGVFTHNSYLAEKSDICPQPDMVAMLKSL